jgi:hypothetical protein
MHGSFLCKSPLHLAIFTERNLWKICESSLTRWLLIGSLQLIYLTLDSYLMPCWVLYGLTAIRSCPDSKEEVKRSKVSECFWRLMMSFGIIRFRASCIHPSSSHPSHLANSFAYFWWNYWNGILGEVRPPYLRVKSQSLIFIREGIDSTRITPFRINSLLRTHKQFSAPKALWQVPCLKKDIYCYHSSLWNNDSEGLQNAQINSGNSIHCVLDYRYSSLFVSLVVQLSLPHRLL